MIASLSTKCETCRALTGVLVMEEEKMSERAYEAVEIAKKSGKLKKGTNEVTKAIEKGQAKLVVIAGDVSPKEITMHLPMMCKDKGIPCVTVPSKDELGAAAGLGLGTVAVAITDAGDGKDLLKEF
jgi:large subunit ribosomal protein L7Ae